MPRIPAPSLASLLLLACAPTPEPTQTSETSATTPPATAGNLSSSSGGDDATDPGPTGSPTTGPASATDPGTDPGTGTGTDLDPTPRCDTLRQDCPAGHKCTGIKPTLEGPYTGTACVPDNAEGGGAAGSICINAADGRDTCGPDSMCVQFGSGEGACLPFCVGDRDAPTCTAPQQVCARTDTVWPLHLCVPPCDPLAYDCPDLQFGALAMVCAPATRGFGCLLRGHLGGEPFGAACINHRDCSGAAHCAAPDDVPGCASVTGCCNVYCDTGAQAQCPLDAQTCVPYHAPDAAPPGREQVGVCAVP